MRILLDHCIPKPFRREFPDHTVKTAAEMGWEDLQNGKLLAEGAKAFDVMVTADKNIKKQQNLDKLPLAVIVLGVFKNTPDVLRAFAPFVERVLPSLRVGQMIEIDPAGNVVEVAPGR